jgi:hypothetical protein
LKLSLEKMKMLNAEVGHCFFKPEDMEYWGSKIETQPDENHCFITSEDNFNATKKLYTIRRFNLENYHVETVGDFQKFETLAAAKAALKSN